MAKQVSILIVDDYLPLTILMSKILKIAGYSVQTASNGFQALAQMRLQIPDVLVSDLYMDGMSGFELLSIVRHRFNHVKVIAMSGSFSGSYVPEKIPADAFYAKGTCSSGGLIFLIEQMHSREDLSSSRLRVPVWISGAPESGSGRELHIVCPECLRSFSSAIWNTPELMEQHCPHCAYQFAIAVVPCSTALDRTMVST